MGFVLTPVTTGKHTFGVTACGVTTLKVDGKEILSHPGFDNVKVEYIMQPGDFEVRADLDMVAGRKYGEPFGSTTSPHRMPLSTPTMMSYILVA
jgi:beta-glucosidase